MGFTHEENDTQFALQFSTGRIKACVIDPKKYTKATDHIKLSEDIKDNLHIHLFHELCHWFHSLQDPKRKDEETEFTGKIFDHQLGRYYFEGAKPKWLNERGDITHEINLWRHNEYVGIEEIRTILGAHKDEYYQDGDDLCENLYRLEIGAPLRYGHLQYDCMLLRDSQYKADLRVINRIINTCNENYMSYQ